MKTLELVSLELKNVLMSDGSQKNVTVQIVPFNRRNDDHVDFAFAYVDMLSRVPSPFSTITDAAVRAVELFVAHKEAESKDVNSDFYAVVHDKRAARIVLNEPSLQASLGAFFENA